MEVPAQLRSFYERRATAQVVEVRDIRESSYSDYAHSFRNVLTCHPRYDGRASVSDFFKQLMHEANENGSVIDLFSFGAMQRSLMIGGLFVGLSDNRTVIDKRIDERLKLHFVHEDIFSEEMIARLERLSSEGINIPAIVSHARGAVFTFPEEPLALEFLLDSLYRSISPNNGMILFDFHKKDRPRLKDYVRDLKQKDQNVLTEISLEDTDDDSNPYASLMIIKN